MAVILDNGVLPASKDCAAEAIYEGKVYKYDSLPLFEPLVSHKKPIGTHFPKGLTLY